MEGTIVYVFTQVKPIADTLPYSHAYTYMCIYILCKGKPCWDGEGLERRGTWPVFSMGMFSPVANIWKDVLNKENNICKEERRWNSEPELNRQKQIQFQWPAEGNWAIRGIQSQHFSLWKSRMEFKENFQEVLSAVYTRATLSSPVASSSRYPNLWAATFLSSPVVFPLLLEACL